MHDIVKKASSPFKSPLTPQEWRVAKMVREGQQNKCIAHAFGVTEHTVKVQMCHIAKKLSLTNRTQVAVWVMERELAYALGLILSQEQKDAMLAALQQTDQNCETLEKLLRQ